MCLWFLEWRFKVNNSHPMFGSYLNHVCRPEVMDQAILRPGRLGRFLYVPLPSPDERGLILKTLARKKPIDTSVDLMTIGRDDACKNFSGADLSALVCSSFLLTACFTCFYLPSGTCHIFFFMVGNFIKGVTFTNCLNLLDE